MSDFDDNDQQALYTGEDTGTAWHPGERTVTMQLELDYLLQRQTDNQLLSKPEEDTWTSWTNTRINILQEELVKEKERCNRKPMEQDQTSKDNTRDAMLLQDQKDEKSLCQFWKMRQKEEPVPCPMPQCLSHLKRKLLPINQAMIERMPKIRKINTLKGSLLRMTPAAGIKVNISKKKMRFVTDKSVHLGGSGFMTRKVGWKAKQRSVLIPQWNGMLGESDWGSDPHDTGDGQEEDAQAQGGEEEELGRETEDKEEKEGG